MAGILKRGMRLQGRLGSYRISKKLAPFIWRATNENHCVVIKQYPGGRPWLNERQALQKFAAERTIRRMIEEINIDVGDDNVVPTLVLEHLDKDLNEIWNARALNTLELKFVARNILQALAYIHARGTVHMDVKPNNILVNCTTSRLSRLREVKLADFDFMKLTYQNNKIIIPAFNNYFRSPELLLGAPFDPSTDIWSLGITLIALALGHKKHIFGKANTSNRGVYSRQQAWFGGLPERLKVFENDEMRSANPVLEELSWLVRLHTGDISQEKYDLVTRPWSFDEAYTTDIAEPDRNFIKKLMKMDPEERPTAEELLKDEWLTGGDIDSEL